MSNYEVINTGRKCVFERVPVGCIYRLRVWARNVWSAVRETPPKEVSREVEVFPGDPRFSDPFAMDIMEYRISFDLPDSANPKDEPRGLKISHDENQEK